MLTLLQGGAICRLSWRGIGGSRWDFGVGEGTGSAGHSNSGDVGEEL